jgi:SAM-dependent methyltransferase
MIVTSQEFIQKWSRVELTERSAAQQHFLDLCDLVGHGKPAELDPKGESFTFEKGAAKEGGGDGWADVWKKDFFGWEYKGKHKDLEAAYAQLLKYRADLENPPLLVVSDMDRIEIHTNFTSSRSETFTIPLLKLGEPRNLEILQHLFHAPDKLRPVVTSKAITEEAALRLGDIAQALRKRGHAPLEVAHFLDRIVFCLFAEDIDLLPPPHGEGKPPQAFSTIVRNFRSEPPKFKKAAAALFAVMATGGIFGTVEIPYFNGDLFRDGPLLDLTREELEALHRVAQLDWSKIEPSIFGTLFERGLDPNKRAQIGAHYTGAEDIETLVEPVVMHPLRREWDMARAAAENLLSAATPAKRRKASGEASLIVGRILDRLRAVKVLDPACGSGNFLYVALRKLKDLEREVCEYGTQRDLQTDHLPLIAPHQMFGIEINAYAHQLAQLTVWIGHLQWMHAYGYNMGSPILQSIRGNFQCKDAILDLSDPASPKEPEWPAVDFIVSNPPFLGGKLTRRSLGDEYVESLHAFYSGRLPPFADLCCYWFEKARAHVEAGKCRRAGLLATQGIRGGANRKVLKRIKETGDIFFAVSDRPWVLDGANVHISMVGFDAGHEAVRVLDGQTVPTVNANLTAAADMTEAARLREDEGLSFIGIQKSGPFDLAMETGVSMIGLPAVGGRPTSDVIRPYWTAERLVKRTAETWVIDFAGLDEATASAYDGPFGHVRSTVPPSRDAPHFRNYPFWLFWRMRPEMREATRALARYVVTPLVSKHRVLTWAETVWLPANLLVVIAREDDYFFGVLHSRLHEVWALKLGTRLETRPRYTPTTCFETFAFPWPPGKEDQANALVQAIAAAAKELDELRTRWLNPPEWTKEEVLEFPGSVDGPWTRYVHNPDAKGIGTVRYPRLVPKDDACAAKLKKRTLTNLYNERPAWLDLAHRKIDAAVFAAYAAATGDAAWTPALTDDHLLEKLLALNLKRVNA